MAARAGCNLSLALHSFQGLPVTDGKDLRCLDNTKSLYFYPKSHPGSNELVFGWRKVGPGRAMGCLPALSCLLAATGMAQGTAALSACSSRTLPSIHHFSFATRRASELNWKSLWSVTQTWSLLTAIYQTHQTFMHDVASAVITVLRFSIL